MTTSPGMGFDESQHPRGSGGQFAANSHAESDLELAGPDPGQAVEGDLLQLQHAQGEVLVATERLAQAAYSLVARRTLDTWPDAASIRLYRSSNQYQVQEVLDVEGNQVASWVDAGLMDSARITSALDALQGSGRADQYIEPHEDGAATLRLDRVAVIEDRLTVSPADIEPGDTLAGDAGGRLDIGADVGPSSAFPGFVTADVEFGTLLLDADLPVEVIRTRSSAASLSEQMRARRETHRADAPETAQPTDGPAPRNPEGHVQDLMQALTDSFAAAKARRHGRETS